MIVKINNKKPLLLRGFLLLKTSILKVMSKKGKVLGQLELNYFISLNIRELNRQNTNNSTRKNCAYQLFCTKQY